MCVHEWFQTICVECKLYARLNVHLHKVSIYTLVLEFIHKFEFMRAKDFNLYAYNAIYTQI